MGTRRLICLKPPSRCAGALRVGFSDEYYFSRRFRQKTGMTPGQYARSQQRRITVTDWTGHSVDIPERPKRVVYHGETLGDVLALGVKPVGGDEAFARGSVYRATGSSA